MGSTGAVINDETGWLRCETTVILAAMAADSWADDHSNSSWSVHEGI